ncbi:MAG: hypothetical protein GF350_12500 [Chitinivibrionales bacterium]|nr:hypothetical protein [Chitinivibrionales bacterium]
MYCFPLIFLLCFSVSVSGDSTFIEPAQSAAPLTPGSVSDSIDTAEPSDSARLLRDTTASPEADTPAERALPDSTAVSPLPEIPDSTREKSLWNDIDTSYRFYHSPYWGFGLGWTLGAFPLFDMWNRGLPSMLSDFGIDSKIPRADFIPAAADTDTVTITYTVQEEPSDYHIYFPLMVSFSPRVDSTHRLSIETSLFLLRKSLISSFQDDSLTNRVDINHSLMYVSLTLGAQYSHALPERYFRVDGVEQTFLNAAVFATPLIYTQTHSDIDTESTANDIFSYLQSRASVPFPRFEAFGGGFSWKIGISSLRVFTPSTGIDLGLYYLGHWAVFFHGNGSQLENGDINPSASKPGDHFSMTAHRFEIRAMLLRGKKPPAPQKQNAHSNTALDTSYEKR